jgi:hypothetical protein
MARVPFIKELGVSRASHLSPLEVFLAPLSFWILSGLLTQGYSMISSTSSLLTSLWAKDTTKGRKLKGHQFTFQMFHGFISYLNFSLRELSFHNFGILMVFLNI